MAITTMDNSLALVVIRSDVSNLHPANPSHFYHPFHSCHLYLGCQQFLLYLVYPIFLFQYLHHQLLSHKFKHLLKFLLLVEDMELMDIITTINIFPVCLNKSVKLFMEPWEIISIRLEFKKPANVIAL